jgi:hypothetical protein
MDITLIQNPCELNNILFEFFVLGLIRTGYDCYSVRLKDVLIEVSNSLSGNLLDRLPVCSYFPVKNVAFDIGDFVACRELCSPTQIVCNYLKAWEQGELAEDLVFRDEDVRNGVRNAVALDSAECSALLTRHYLQNQGSQEFFVPSFSTMNVFVNVLASQLLRLSSSPYFEQENLEFMGSDPANIKRICIEALVQVARDFASRSVSAVRHSQQRELDIDYAKNAAGRFESLVQWSKSNHLMLSFNEDGSISLLYREASQVPREFFELLRSQQGERENFQLLSHEQLLEKLRLLVGEGLQKDFPDYVMALDCCIWHLFQVLQCPRRNDCGRHRYFYR